MERYPNLKEEVGSSIPGYGISSLLAINLVRWSTASCDLALACRHFVSIKKKKKKKKLASYGRFDRTSGILVILGFLTRFSFHPRVQTEKVIM